MSKVYEFTIVCVGSGDDEDEAWQDAKDVMRYLDSDYPLDEVTKYELIEDNEEETGIS